MENRVYLVKNRSSSMVVYSIQEMGIRREFQPLETKKITYEELEKLSYQDGGRELIGSFLQIEDEKVTNGLNINTQPEYYMSEQQIVELLKTGTLEALLDCLDYAPVGVIDLLKLYAVKLPVTDTGKITAIKQKTGFDVFAALQNAEKDETEESSGTSTNNAQTAQPITSGRRTNASYKVVKKTE